MTRATSSSPRNTAAYGVGVRVKPVAARWASRRGARADAGGRIHLTTARSPTTTETLVWSTVIGRSVRSPGGERDEDAHVEVVRRVAGDDRVHQVGGRSGPDGHAAIRPRAGVRRAGSSGGLAAIAGGLAGVREDQLGRVGGGQRGMTGD